MGRKVLATIKKSDISQFNIEPYGPSPQSFCLISSTNRVVVHKHTDEKSAELIRYTSGTKNKTVKSQQNHVTGTGHCNGCTYCDATREIIVTRGRNNGDNKKEVSVFDASTLKHKRNIKFSVKISGVAYDRVTGQFYVSCGGSMHVFTYNNFMKGGKPSKTFSVKFSGMWQDIGGFNGIIYKIVGKYHGTNNYIDGYRASDGKYIGSIHVPFYEIESVAVDENNILHMVSTNTRWLMNTGFNVNKAFQGVNAAVNNNQKSVVVTPTRTMGTAPQAFVAAAQKELNAGVKETGENHTKYGKWYGMDGQPWCAIFVCWCAHEALGASWTKTFEKSALAFGVGQGVVNKGGKWIKKASKGPTTHVGIIKSVSNSNKATTIEGNAGDKVNSRTISVPNGTRMGDLIIFYNGNVGGIARPKWPDGSFVIDGMGGEGAEGPVELTLQVSPEQLYSSENYHYEDIEEEQESEYNKKSKERTQAMKDFLANIKVESRESVAIPDVQLLDINNISKRKKSNTKVYGNISGSGLPSTINYVEAPYAKVTIGGVEIGTYKNGNYPNYINSIVAKKTNGSMNEYTINLIHQISPGDNPNYIDNLIAKNGYDKITIEYGDAEAGITFRNAKALVTSVKNNFDFFNNCISYTITATSSSIMSIISKKNYPAVTEKPSTIINNMLYDSGELLQYFPGMSNKTLVSSNNLIPNTDKTVSFDAMNDISPFDYLTKLVSSMSSITNDNSSYYLDIKDSGDSGAYFQVKQIQTSLPSGSRPFMYEVDINFPDEGSLVYDFSINEDFSWPLAYKYSGNVKDYNYGIDSSGKLVSSVRTSNLKNLTSAAASSISDVNWWKNVTEFPITASLDVKGLTTNILLLNYIKVNVYYFGRKRNTSGVYIVTGQEDSLSGNGFKTRLDLLRVAGDNQYITVDGRVAT